MMLRMYSDSDVRTLGRAPPGAGPQGSPQGSDIHTHDHTHARVHMSCTYVLAYHMCAHTELGLVA